MSIWKKETSFNYDLYEEVDSFFENLKGQKEVEYREGQHMLALDVLDALKNKEMLLIEAGVGIGKSWGYLIPLLYASKDKEKFKGFLISTSSIALQEQLKDEVEKLSKMLNIDIPVTIAKGRNNYICQKRLISYMKKHSDDEMLNKLLEKVEQGVVDKEEYKEIPNKVWKNINVNHVNCASCLHKKDCGYMLKRESFPTANYVICNHDLLVESLKRDSNDSILKEPSILVIDEAHNLEDKIRNSYQGSISKNKLEALIINISCMINDDLDFYEDNPIITSLNNVFRLISLNAKNKYRRNAKEDIEVFDEEISGFDISFKLKEAIIDLDNKLETLIIEASNYRYLDKKIINYINILKNYVNIFRDLIKNNSDNIYWVSFISNTNEHVSLEYVRKDIAKEASRLLSNNNYGKVFTSATITTNGNYNFFADSLNLNEIKGIPLIKEFPQDSPYDYHNNALLYLASDVISSKSKDHSLYLDSLALKIDELINITEGRSLVLFTSKEDMKQTYQRVNLNNHNFNIMLQTDDVNIDDLKARFMEDKNSVLFATGSFYEGIDIKGEALENVIIAKLPFPVVNPIIEEKASRFVDGFSEVYLPLMLIKLKQGAGRLIRSSTDKGIVSILDARCNEYKEDILNSLPFTNVTDNIKDVEEFSLNKLGHAMIKK